MAELETDQIDKQEITALTAEIVGAYVSCHTVAVNDLPALITTVGQQLAGLGSMSTNQEEEKTQTDCPDQAISARRRHHLPYLR